MRLDLRDTMQAEAYLLGGYELDTVRFITRRLHGGGVFVDVGANIGLVSLPVAMANSQLQVIAFEPHPGNAMALRANVAANPAANVDVREVALGEQPGRVHLTTDDARESGWFRVSDTGQGVEVPMDTLDRLLAGVHVDVMKVDAEGSEPAILRGAEQLLRDRRIGCLIMETNAGHGVSGGDLANHVQGYGYKTADVPVPLGRRLRRLGEDTIVFVPG
jgi:FkbM family methyltransferase